MKILDRLEKLRAEATHGEWSFDGCSITNWNDGDFDMEWIANGVGDGINERTENDGELIVSTVNAIDALVAVARAAEGLNRHSRLTDGTWETLRKALAVLRALGGER